MKKRLSLWMVREKGSQMVEFYNKKPTLSDKGYYVRGTYQCKWLGYLLNKFLRIAHDQVFKINLTIETDNEINDFSRTIENHQ